MKGNEDVSNDKGINRDIKGEVILSMIQNNLTPTTSTTTTTTTAETTKDDENG